MNLLPLPGPIMRPAAPAKLLLTDLADISYTFYLQPFSDPLPMQNVVYAFVSHDNRIGYIGRAENLQERQRSHEHRKEALMKGFGRLYVHWQGLYDPIDFKTAEKNLIRAYCPELNTQLNWLRT